MVLEYERVRLPKIAITAGYEKSPAVGSATNGNDFGRPRSRCLVIAKVPAVKFKARNRRESHPRVGGEKNIRVRSK